MGERNKLEFISSVEIMNTPMKKQHFIVDEIIYPGLHILSGDPKIGKSWMMMDMCLSIAKGEKFLGRRTETGHVVYMALEDTFSSLQSRMYELTDEPTDNLQYVLLGNSIGNGLEDDLRECKKVFSDLKLIVIDTLQKVRENTKWKLLDAPPEYKKDIFSSAIHDFMMEQKEFRGTASELCELLRQRYSEYEFQNNWIYRDLLQHDDEIRSLGIDYEKTKSNGVRSIYVSYDEQRDTSGGIILCAEVVDPAVPEECINGDISSESVDVDESDITTFAVPADGDDFIAMMAEGLRNQLASQGIYVKPFNSTE